MRRIVITAAALGLVLGAAACGSAAGQHSSHPATHPAAATRTTAPVSPEVAADKALCKVWTADIGSDDLAITHAATGAESPKLVLDINKALASTTVQAGLTTQVKVTSDCALAANGVAP